MSRPVGMTSSVTPTAIPLPSQNTGAATKRSGLSGVRRTTRAYPNAIARQMNACATGSALPLASGGKPAPSVTDTIATTGRRAPPRTMRADDTTRAPRRCRYHPDRKNESGARISAHGRRSPRTSSNEKAISPKTPVNSNRTPTEERSSQTCLTSGSHPIGASVRWSMRPARFDTATYRTRSTA